MAGAPGKNRLTPMSEQLLLRIARRRNFSASSLRVAERLLIEQVPAKAVAVEAGLHLSRIYAIRKDFLSAWQNLASDPATRTIRFE